MGVSVKSRPSENNRGVCLLCAILVLSGCVETTGSSAKKEVSQDRPGQIMMPDAPAFRKIDPGTPEELLAAEGKWNLVEEGDVYDPAQAHLNARSKVNPKQMKKRDDLIARFDPATHNGRDGKFRVLRMEPQGKGWQDDLEGAGYEVAETSIAKPSQKVVGAEVVNEIRAAFAQANAQVSTQTTNTIEEPQSVSGVPIPGVKPQRAGISAEVAAAETASASGLVKPPSVPASKQKGQKSSSSELVETDFVLNVPDHENSKKRKAPSAQTAKSNDSEGGFFSRLKKSLKVDEEKQEQPATLVKGQPPAIPVAAVEQGTANEVIISGQETKGADAKLIGFRSAIHEGRTRIAMDVSTSVRYKVAVDHIRNVLRVKLEKTRWTEPPTGTMRASSLLGTYVTKPQPDGSVILEIRLKNKAKIADTMILKPGVTSNHRIVIDLET
jgi:hypothetical protein